MGSGIPIEIAGDPRNANCGKCGPWANLALKLVHSIVNSVCGLCREIGHVKCMIIDLWIDRVAIICYIKDGCRLLPAMREFLAKAVSPTVRDSFQLKWKFKDCSDEQSFLSGIWIISNVFLTFRESYYILQSAKKCGEFPCDKRKPPELQL